MAIVTGSTYGIGEAIVKVLAKKGEISIITGRTQGEGRRCMEETNGNESKAEYYPLDVTNEARVKEIVDAVYEKYGKIDILLIMQA